MDRAIAPPGSPLPPGRATAALARCAVTTVGLLASGRLDQPRGNVGRDLHFADGTTTTVYRETVAADIAPADPAALIVGFRLRHVRQQWGHAAFRTESLLNTILFAGFPGFVSKLWCAHDENHLYRGVYDWDGPDRADRYARALWQVLALVSEPDSIHHVVVPGVRRDDVLAEPGAVPTDEQPDQWWRPLVAGMTAP